MAIARLANEFFQLTKPWDVVKLNRARAGSIISLLTNVVALLAALAAPYMPGFSRKVSRASTTHFYYSLYSLPP
jgi:methionyl-tRNA synthetase